MYILYVEDEPNDAQLVERYARASGIQMTVARNIRDAKAALAQNPDLILVDILLDQSRQGYQFVKDLRTNGYRQPIIAVTGLSLPTDMEECRRAGCDEVIVKPYNITLLAQTIERYTS
jgi:CheY-like chemotaxis protein